MKNLNLIAARKAKRLNQQELAEQLGCRKSTISNWENGYSRPSLEDAFKLATLLDSDITILFFANEVQESQTKEVSSA